MTVRPVLPQQQVEGAVFKWPVLNLLIRPGARLRREMAEGLRVENPSFRSGYEAILEFLRIAVKLGMMREMRG